MTTDLFALTGELVDIASESRDEQAIVAFIEQRLRPLEHLRVARVGDNLVARTELGHGCRVVLGGHTDTVPANGNATARVDGETIWGVGSADMKGGLAVMLASAELHTSPAVDLTYVFYAREEVASAESGLEELFEAAPDLLVADLAILGEPTSGAIEAGCQGSIRADVTLRGSRAHTARAWMGRNAIHRLAPLLAVLNSYEPRQPVLAGCRFHEALLAVGIEGGVSGNVVPDSVTLSVAHRFAPDRSAAEAEQHLRAVLAPHLEATDEVEIIDVAPAAAPAVDHPLVAAIIERHQLDVRAKLGWTDVARFAARGVPAINLGPGDPAIAHTANEHLEQASLDRVWIVIDDLVNGAGTSL